jgi:hypothetical protein
MLYDYRLVLAENLFYGRVPMDESFNWNPEGVIHHHYDLMTNLDSHLRRRRAVRPPPARVRLTWRRTSTLRRSSSRSGCAPIPIGIWCCT